MVNIRAGMDQTDSYVATLWPTWCSWSRLHQTVEIPQLQSFQVVDISFAAQRQSLMVQTVRQTVDIP